MLTSILSFHSPADITHMCTVVIGRDAFEYAARPKLRQNAKRRLVLSYDTDLNTDYGKRKEPLVGIQAFMRILLFRS